MSAGTSVFGQELRRRRKHAGLSQQALGEALATLAWDQLKVRVGIDGNLVSRWERGTAAPRPPYPELLSRLFQTTVEDLGLRPGLPSQPGVGGNPGAACRVRGSRMVWGRGLFCLVHTHRRGVGGVGGLAVVSQ
jgi:transcriptional regulator with XRE-family HTH domain